MEELKDKVGLRAPKRIMIYLKLYHTSNNTCPILQNVVCNVIRIGRVIRIYEINLKFLISHIYFLLDACKLCNQSHYSTQKMMGQICNLETVEP